MLYAKGQSPFHAAVSRRYFELLLAEPGLVNVTVFGATGVVGRALAAAAGRARADRRLAHRA